MASMCSSGVSWVMHSTSASCLCFVGCHHEMPPRGTSRHSNLWHGCACGLHCALNNGYPPIMTTVTQTDTLQAAFLDCTFHMYLMLQIKAKLQCALAVGMVHCLLWQHGPGRGNVCHAGLLCQTSQDSLDWPSCTGCSPCLARHPQDSG